MRKHSSGIVSGWGLVNKDVRDHYVGFPLDSSKTLHFGNVIIQNLNNCKEFIQVNDKDLNEGHLCGVTKDLSQRIGWVITFKKFYIYDFMKIYLVKAIL